MARNREKANLMFNRWSSLKAELAAGGDKKERRPYLASECTNLSDAEKWRREIIREVTRKVAEIQNAGLGEARIRDLNDEINKLLREKGHWERQIKALGGPDYRVTAPRMFDAEGKAVVGTGGYKYFGAAKDLPGVRELFATAAAEASKRKRGDILKLVTPDYYGFRDDDDGVLVEAEAVAETAWRGEGEAEWVKAHGGVLPAVAGVEGEGDADDDDDALVAAAAAMKAGSTSNVGVGGAGGGASSSLTVVPLSEVEAMLARRKRELLLARYSSPELQATVTLVPGAPASEVEAKP